MNYETIFAWYDINTQKKDCTFHCDIASRKDIHFIKKVYLIISNQPYWAGLSSVELNQINMIK